MAEKNIGYVVELTGSAQVKTVEGIIKVLSVGDKIHEGDVLTTGVGSEILLEFYNGQQLQVSENSEVLLDESVFADLQPLGDDRADQLAELQQLIVEGIDLADLEAAAAGDSQSVAEALHTTSVYTRDGEEGVVDTQATPFGFDGSGPDNEDTTGDDNVFVATNESSSATSTVSTMPNAGISVNAITDDDVINAQESGQSINITGSVSGDAGAGDTVSFIINGTTYTGTVAPDNTFNITVAGSDLASQTSFEATVSGIDENGAPYSETTTSTHSVDTSTAASITVDNITSDDILSPSESGAMVNVTGSVGGDAGPGDVVSFVINGNAYLGAVAADNSFSIAVAGADLAVQTSFDATVTGSDTAGNAFSATTTSDHIVNLANNNPDAIDDSDTTNEDTGIDIDVLANDVDLDGDVLTVTGVTQGGNGNVSINADGTVNYTPNLNFEGPDSFTYTISDGKGGTDTATVNITVNGINDIAIVSSDSQVLAEADSPLSTSGTLTSTDIDNPDNTFTPSSTTGTIGDFSIDIAGNWTFTANSAFDNLNVGDSVNETFNVTSVDGTPSTVQITINGTNDAATVSSDSQTLTETDAPVSTSGTLTSTDVDNADNAFAATSTTGTIGDFSIDANGSWTFTANSAFDNLNVGDSVNETFNVTSVDGTPSTVQITINGTNDAATVSSDAQVLTETDAPVSTSGTLTSTDVDNVDNAFTVTSITGTIGDFNIDANGNWAFAANSAFDSLNVGDSVNETFNVTSVDGTPSTVQITINGTNDVATVSSDSQTLTETDAPVSTSGTLTSTDVDNLDNAFTATTVTGTIGNFSIDAAGSWTFTANSAFDNLNVGDSVNETFNVTSVDGTPSTVQITINGTNDTATVSSDAQVLTETDAPVSTSGTLTSTDVDNVDNAFTATTVNGTIGDFNIDANGNWTFTANSAFDNLNVGDSVNETFNVTSVDGTSSTIQITINGTNDAATVSSDNQTLTETDAILSTSGTLTSTDVDNPDNEFTPATITNPGGIGTFTMTATGDWTFTANSAFDSLNVGDSVSETFNVSSVDGYDKHGDSHY